ncbi:MAG: heavy-metal-associated domain-containing protein [Nanoarchaeota archaeon]|nr:heavy-metal-associated domain-containing protein [Nanoarchaeota archaeon]
MKTIIQISGMHCKSCSMLIKSDLEDLGVNADIDHETGKSTLEFDETKITLEKIKATIKEAGYSVN